MAKPERVLRISGTYHRSEKYSETEFHAYMSKRHGVERAKIHAKHGVLKYQLAFNTSATRALARSMQFPYTLTTHDVEIEYYVRDVATLKALSADPDFRALHVECLPYVQMERSTVTVSWVEVFVEDGRLVNVGADGGSMYREFEEMDQVEGAESLAGYYEGDGKA